MSKPFGTGFPTPALCTCNLQSVLGLSFSQVKFQEIHGVEPQFSGRKSTDLINMLGLPGRRVSGGREILCRSCGGHLGHVFMDGQCLGANGPERHCVNSMALVYVAGHIGLRSFCLKDLKGPQRGPF